MTVENFIQKAKKVHGDKYDYSKVQFEDVKDYVTIICPKHGEFTQRAQNHLRGYGCKDCGYEKLSEENRFSKESFIKKSEELYGQKYDYSKVDYKNSRTKVCIICPKHGEFWITPNDFLDGHACPLCAAESRKEKLSDNTKTFIEKAKKVHGDKYDYSKTVYIRNNALVTITCPKHGDFLQTPHCHLRGHGCLKCHKEKGAHNKLTREEFIRKAKSVHGNKYDYSKVVYINTDEKVCIICPKHGKFWQRACDHLNGHGCAKCYKSALENDIITLLEDNNIRYEYNKRYKFIENLQLDFYLPEKKIAIECQGIQHFEPVEKWGGKKQFEKNIVNDNKKKQLCENNGVKMYYYSNLGIDYPYEVIEDKERILELIKNGQFNKEV